MSGNEALRLEPHETELIGRKTSKDGKRVADETARRITRLLRDWLKLVAEAKDGDRLFRDPSDWRLWEASYKKSKIHGGPPTLKVISKEAAQKKYAILL